MEARRATHTLGYFTLSNFSATNDVVPNNIDGLVVDHGSWQTPPPEGTTISFNFEAITTLNVEAEYEYFTDDPWNPEWTNADWPQHKQENTDALDIGSTTHAPGTLQLENEYEVVLQGDDGNTYTLVAVSAVTVNPYHIGNYDYRIGPEHGVIGFTFQGPWPPQGVTLTFVENVDGEKIDWENFVPEEGIPCFTSGTMILTDRGEVAVDDLQIGNLVMTRDNGLQPVRWIGSRKLSVTILAIKSNLRPIRIMTGALGEDLPAQDLLVSPQHRILVRSRIAQKMFGTDEVLVAAKQLLQLDGIDVAHDLREVEYFHILFDRHEVVISNGAETESLYTGPQALKAVGAAAREEIFTLFPELREMTDSPLSVRLLASGRQARKLALRHQQHRRALVS